MLAAQVNARKHDQLRMILGFVWNGGLGLCEALLGWLLIAAAVRWPCFRAVMDRRSTPPFACWPRSRGSPLHCVRFGRWLGARCIAFVFMCFWWASEQDVRVSRGRFHDLSLRLRSMSASLHCCVLYRGLLYVISLVCGCPASKGGILRAISPAGQGVNFALRS
jgi:hypothetical protein